MRLRANCIEGLIWRVLDAEAVLALNVGDFVILAEVSKCTWELAETSTGIVNNISAGHEGRNWRVDYEWTEGAGGNCFIDAQDVKQARDEGFVYMFAVLQTITKD